MVYAGAMISLSNLSDDRMRHAKSGQWWENEGQRALANNSVAYTEARHGHSCVSGQPWLSLSQVSVVSSAVMQQTHVARNGV